MIPTFDSLQIVGCCELYVQGSNFKFIVSIYIMGIDQVMNRNYRRLIIDSPMAPPPSINPSSHSSRSPHCSVTITRGVVCAEQWSRQVITRRANQDLMKHENIPSPKRHSDSHTLVADLQTHVEQTNRDQGLLHCWCPLQKGISS